MKYTLPLILFVAVLGGQLPCGCSTERQRNFQVLQPAPEPEPAIDYSIINDRNNWVDPARQPGF